MQNVEHAWAAGAAAIGHIAVFKNQLSKEINALNIASPGTHDVHLEIKDSE